MYNPIGEFLGIIKNASTKNQAFMITSGGYSPNDIKRLLQKYELGSWDYQIVDYDYQGVAGTGIWFRVHQGQYDKVKSILDENNISYI